MSDQQPEREPEMDAPIDQQTLDRVATIQDTMEWAEGEAARARRRPLALLARLLKWLPKRRKEQP